MSQSNLSRFYQKKKKRNSEILSGIISGRSKYAKTKKNSSNFEENLRSAPEFEITEQRAESPRFEALEPIVVIEKRAELPVITTPRFERIESRATTPRGERIESRAITPRYERIESRAESPEATSSVTAAAAETTTSRLASKRRRTEAGSVEQHSDGNIRKNVK
jgi:hypothetical protein